MNEKLKEILNDHNAYFGEKLMAYHFNGRLVAKHQNKSTFDFRHCIYKRDEINGQPVIVVSSEHTGVMILYVNDLYEAYFRWMGDCLECKGVGHFDNSNCCDAKLYEETDICSDCKEHADNQKCEDCLGGRVQLELELLGYYHEL